MKTKKSSYPEELKSAIPTTIVLTIMFLIFYHNVPKNKLHIETIQKSYHLKSIKKHPSLHILSNDFRIDNFLIFSVGHFDNNEHRGIVSIGIIGKVFVLDKIAKI